MSTPIIGSFEMVNVTDAKISGGDSEGGEAAELIGTACQFKVLTMAKTANRNASGIWNYFGIAEKQNATPSEHKQKAADRILCLICFEKGIVHVYKTSTSSGNLWRHLHRKHGMPIPKDRISGATINLRGNFEIADIRNVKRDFIHDDSTVFSSDLERRSLTDNEQSLDMLIGDGLRFDADTMCKDIGSMLITEVAKRPALYEWNCKTVANTKKVKRDELWHEVYESLGRIIEVNRLQKMWKNIRDRYKKLKNLELDGITEASSRYKYYDQLRFLETHTRNSSIPPISSNDSNNSKDTKQFDETFENTEHDAIDFANCLINHSDETPEKKLKFNSSDDEISPKLYATLRTSNFENTVNTYDDDVVIPTEISTVKSSCSDPASPAKEFDTIPSNVYTDEFDLFGRLIAEKLRKLPTSRIDDIEIKILQLIRREEGESNTQ